MICQVCSNDTSTVICSKCGTNVIWYNKYGKTNSNNSDINSNDDKKENSVEFELTLKELVKGD